MPNRRSRWILVGTILGSGAVFVEGSVTMVALPAIARDFHLGIAGLQWVLNGYLLTLSALMLLGGAVGDRFSRRGVFAIGLVGFSIASIACALAPNLLLLVLARVLQGAAGALVVPNSLALLETTFTGPERGAAVGHWAAWSAVSAAFGPLVGGWLVDAASWRWVFVCIAPIAAAAVVAVGVGRDAHASRAAKPHVDYAGAALITLALAGMVGALIVGPDTGFNGGVLVAGIGGVAVLLAFIAVERRAASPLVPLDIFRNRTFTGVNATTLVVYAALNGLFFLLMLQLQGVLGYSALQAGASLLPINVLMVTLSPVAGRAAARVGPRLLMTGGSLVAAAGMLLFVRVQPGARYATSVLPAAIVFGIGLASFVAPLTSVALGALGERRAGLASGVNNAVARLGGLLAVAVLPLAAGLGGAQQLRGGVVATGFARAMMICAALCAVGGVIAALTIRGPASARRPR
ncbi:MAG TPA: DHA2 family efflux MFS transporter permease subunit [Gemmatimonadaceae bacterium]